MYKRQVKDNQTRPVLRDCLFYALVGEGKLPLGFINHKHPVKVGFGFYQAGLDGIAQPVLGGLVNYLAWRQGLHSRQRSPGGAGGGKAQRKGGLALAGVALQDVYKRQG